jgi:threonine dehydrogenase-like Zn-dependent dehydrogenase
MSILLVRRAYTSPFSNNPSLIIYTKPSDSSPTIHASQISDVSYSFAPIEPHAVTRETIPIGMGHEFSGTILEVHPEVPEASSFEIGQKCAIQPTIYCQSCGACRNGVENACANGGFIGLSGKSLSWL